MVCGRGIDCCLTLGLMAIGLDELLFGEGIIGGCREEDKGGGVMIVILNKQICFN